LGKMNAEDRRRLGRPDRLGKIRQLDHIFRPR
jgi:hypothetical protein